MKIYNNEPFLKWAGGKRIFADQIIATFPKRFKNYFEPFLGGGAVYFSLQPKNALLSDINKDLIITYNQIKINSKLIIKNLAKLKISEAEYYKIRMQKPEKELEIALRFLYLNKTAFNGIYRVNQKGEFNVPFGCKPGTILCPKDNLLQSSRILKNVRLECWDFEKSFQLAKRDDLIFADPPYTVMHNMNGFVKYNEKIFSWEDQIRLSVAAKDAIQRGVKVFITNANHFEIIKLYKGFNICILNRNSCISAKTEGRKITSELLIFAD